MGIIIKGDAKFNIIDLLEINANAEALAGAQLKAGGKFIVSYEGVEVELKAEAFAGLKIKGSVSGKLTLGGRDITTLKVAGQAWAGAGATGEIGFKCSIFGEIHFKLNAGAAVGVGAEGGFAVTLDPKAITYGTLNLVWVYASEHGIKNKGRVHFLPLEENLNMSNMATTALKGMMTELGQQEGDEIDKLQRWNLIQSKMVNG